MLLKYSLVGSLKVISELQKLKELSLKFYFLIIFKMTNDELRKGMDSRSDFIMPFTRVKVMRNADPPGLLGLSIR